MFHITDIGIPNLFLYYKFHLYFLLGFSGRIWHIQSLLLLPVTIKEQLSAHNHPSIKNINLASSTQIISLHSPTYFLTHPEKMLSLKNLPLTIQNIPLPETCWKVTYIYPQCSSCSVILNSLNFGIVIKQTWKMSIFSLSKATN